MRRVFCRLSFLDLFLVGFLLSVPARTPAATPSSTTTVLAIAPEDYTVPAGTLLSFKATVSSGGNLVSPGQVLFCNANALYCADLNLLGQAQLTKDGSASIHIILPIGQYNVRAEFRGTNAYAASTSSSQSLTVSGAYSTTTAIGAISTSGPSALTGTVASYGQVAPTGSVFFRDTANHNVSLESEPLATPLLIFNSVANPVVPNMGIYGAVPLQVNYAAVADINGDGYPDIFSFANGTDYVLTLLGNGDGTFRVGPTTAAGGFDPGPIAVGDFNNDGIPDFALNYSTDVFGGVNTSYLQIFLGKGDGTFSNVSNISSGYGNGFGAIYVGDFNHDGNSDLLVVTNLGVAVFLGDGTGHFSLKTTLNISPNSAIRVADVNGDDKQDLIFTNNAYSSSAGVSILLGNGDGTFTAGTPLAFNCGYVCKDVLVADFNGDGKPDLAVADSGLSTSPGGLYIFLGNGDGTFQPGSGYSDNPGTVALGDFNGDGKLDIADTGIVDNGLRGHPSIFPGNGDGTFGNAIQLFPGENFQPGSYWDTFSLLGDFNNDGMTDLLPLNNWGPTQILLTGWQATVTATSGIADGTFGVNPVLANYPGDETHLASSSGTVPLEEAKIGTMIALNVTPLPATPGQTLRLYATISPSTVGSLLPTGSVTFLDGPKVLGVRSLFNNTAAIASLPTNALDLGFKSSDLTAYYSGDTNFSPAVSNSVELSKAGALLPASSTQLSVSPTSEVSAGTVVTLSASVVDSGTPGTSGLVFFYGTVPQHAGEVLLGQAQLTPAGAASIKLRLGSGMHALRAAFQGTNASQASTSIDQTLTVTGTANTGTSYFLTPTTSLYLDTAQSAVVAADFNNDGILDAATITASNELAIVIQNPDGTFYQKITKLPAGSNYSPTVADFNGDGVPDLAILDSNNSTGSLTIYLGDGAGLFEKKQTIAVPNLSSLVIGDFNRDGIPDLAIIGPAQTVSIFIGRGNGEFEDPGTVNLGVNAIGTAVVADFNGDGIPDIAIPVQSSVNPIILLLGNGNGTFVQQGVPTPSNTSGSLAVADLNGDGFADLVFNHSVLLGNGNGTFTPFTGQFPDPGTPFSQGILVDVNDDGIPDYVTLDQFGDVVILLGTGDGGFASGPVVTDNIYGNGGSGFAIGDFNGDGIPDVMEALGYEVDIFENPPPIKTMAEYLGTLSTVPPAAAGSFSSSQ
jgi:hypothetical protein